MERPIQGYMRPRGSTQRRRFCGTRVFYESTKQEVATLDLVSPIAKRSTTGVFGSEVHGRGLKPPRTDRIDKDRRWRVSSLAPHLGHMGLEFFRTVESVPRVRIIINGESRSCIPGGR